MGTILSILIILASIALVLIVLVQNSKGGGLSSNFASSNQIMGAPKTADFLEKTTWVLAGIIIVLSLVSSKYISYTSQKLEPSVITAPINNAQAPDMQSPQPDASQTTAPATPSLPTPVK